MPSGEGNFPKHLPTPAEIEEQCLLIQQRWTPRDKRQRLASAYRTQHVDLGLPVIGKRHNGKVIGLGIKESEYKP